MRAFLSAAARRQPARRGTGALVRFRGPLADSYAGAVALVLFALTPYLVLTTAIQPLQELFAHDTGLSAQALELTSGMANAAYAFGTVLAVQLTSRLPVRRVLVASAVAFIVSSVFAAWAPVAGLFVAGRVGQGLSTGLMLISAVPPLVIGWGREKMPITAAVMNLGIFGAVALGPVVGGVSSGAQSWRALFWLVAGLGVAALAFALLTYEDQEPQSPDAPVDLIALVLASGGCAALFLGASELATHRMLGPIVLIPLLGGAVAIVALLVEQYLKRRPLIPAERLASTLPTFGIVIAMGAGAASVAVVELAQSALQAKHASPSHAGMLFWPYFGAAVLTALVFGRLFFTRWLPAYALSGLGMLAAGAVVLTGVGHGGEALVVVGSGLVGLGVGACVSPALFVAGLSLPSQQIARIFAAVELLRGVAAFAAGPILLHLAMTTGGGGPVGVRTAMWVAVGIVGATAAVAVAVYAGGGARLERPDVDTWLEGEEPALESPPLFARIRGRQAVSSRR
jgi:MFS family permease